MSELRKRAEELVKYLNGYQAIQQRHIDWARRHTAMSWGRAGDERLGCLEEALAKPEPVPAESRLRKAAKAFIDKWYVTKPLKGQQLYFERGRLSPSAIRDLKKALESTEPEVDWEKAALAEEGQKKEAQLHIRGLQLELGQTRADLAAARNRQLDHSADMCSTNAVAYRKERDALKKDYKLMRDTVNALQLELDQAITERDDLKASNEKARERIDELVPYCDMSEELSAKLRDMTRFRNEAIAERDNFAKRLKETKEKHSQYLNENSDLKKELELTASKRDEWRSAYSEVQERCDGLRATIADNQRVTDREMGIRVAAEREVSFVRKELTSWSAKARKYEGKHRDLQDAYDLLLARLDDKKRSDPPSLLKKPSRQDTLTAGAILSFIGLLACVWAVPASVEFMPLWTHDPFAVSAQLTGALTALVGLVCGGKASGILNSPLLEGERKDGEEMKA
jgi:uncharacterized coiled-coil DUF342 family protein